MAHGTKTVSADAELSTSGQPVVVFSVSIVSGAGGDGQVILRNGTDGSGTALLPLAGTQSQTVTIPLGDKGLMFPNGCFIDLDANVTQVTVTYERDGYPAAAGQIFTVHGSVCGTGVPVMVYGLSATNSGGADDVVDLYNNSQASNPPTEEVTIPAGKTTYTSFPGGIAFTSDCFIEPASGIICTVIYQAISSAKPLPQDAAYATGRILLGGDTSGLVGLVLNIGGATVTEGVDWTRSVNAGTCATRIATAVNAKSTSAGCSAAAGGTAVNLTALNIGSEGNRNILTASTTAEGNLTLSGSTLTGGLDAIPYT